MHLSSILATGLAAVLATPGVTVIAHSWLECTDYRFTPGSDDAKVWNREQCFGRARCGRRQAGEGFGIDTGFNYHSNRGCQCGRAKDNYEGISRAAYTPGQRVCVAYPPKNHVAAPCTNAYIPDAGTVITRTAVNPSNDVDFVREYANANGQHVSGEVDYKGFQNCPNFCADKEHALCTMCFDLEADLAPGEYTFKWVWSFNDAEDAYTTCWEATVGAASGGGGGGGSGDSHPPPTPSAADSTPSIAPTPSGSRGSGSHEDDEEAGDDIECEDGSDDPTNYPTTPAMPAPAPTSASPGQYESGERAADAADDSSAADNDDDYDCNLPLPVPTAPTTSSPGSQSPAHPDCGVSDDDDDDKDKDNGVGVVRPYSDE